jgi:hypothetical protein
MAVVRPTGLTKNLGWEKPRRFDGLADLVYLSTASLYLGG